MGPERVSSCTGFEGHRRVATGTVAEVAYAVKTAIEAGATGPIVIFDDVTAQPVEIDFRGSVEDVLARLPVMAGDEKLPSESAHIPPRGPGRPKLGVVPREVTLLPRHWEWLNDQPGGASVALRKLVETARKANEARDRARHAQEATYRFMAAIAGDFPGFEEANRALFAGDPARFVEHVDAWPADIREHAKRLAAPAFETVLLTSTP